MTDENNHRRQAVALFRYGLIALVHTPGTKGLYRRLAEKRQHLGNLEASRTAYRESLDICRRLREAFPGHPQFARDLVSIETLARAVGETSNGDGLGAS